MSWLSERIGIDWHIGAELSKVQLWAAQQTFGAALQADITTALIEIVKADPSITLAACQTTDLATVNTFLATAVSKLPIPESIFAQIIVATTEPTLDQLISQSVATGYAKLILQVNGTVPGNEILAAQGIVIPNLTAA